MEKWILIKPWKQTYIGFGCKNHSLKRHAEAHKSHIQDDLEFHNQKKSAFFLECVIKRFLKNMIYIEQKEGIGNKESADYDRKQESLDNMWKMNQQ